MVLTCVHVYVKEGFVDEFIEATKMNYTGTVTEPGNVRFDVLQDGSDLTKFMLYEVFESEEAVAAHKKTEHYLKWRETVADWMAKPREGIRHKIICPEEREKW